MGKLSTTWDYLEFDLIWNCLFILEYIAQKLHKSTVSEYCEVCDCSVFVADCMQWVTMPLFSDLGLVLHGHSPAIPYPCCSGLCTCLELHTGGQYRNAHIDIPGRSGVWTTNSSMPSGVRTALLPTEPRRPHYIQTLHQSVNAQYGGLYTCIYTRYTNLCIK